MNYRCVAWVLNADGVRRPECSELIPEAELSGVFVAGSRLMGLAQGQVNVPAWLAVCEFARRVGFAPRLWQVEKSGRYMSHNEEARLAARLPVIIRAEEKP